MLGACYYNIGAEWTVQWIARAENAPGNRIGVYDANSTVLFFPPRVQVRASRTDERRFNLNLIARKK